MRNQSSSFSPHLSSAATAPTTTPPDAAISTTPPLPAPEALTTSTPFQSRRRRSHLDAATTLCSRCHNHLDAAPISTNPVLPAPDATILCSHMGTTHVIEFLNGLKNDGCLNTMHVLLVYLQQAPHEQRPLAAVLLLLLDLLGNSKCCSFYGREGIDAIVAALERSLHNKKVQDQCTRALLLLGGRFSSAGEALSEAWLLKRAGIHDGQENLFRSKERNGDEFERAEKEEKATENWLRKLAIVLLTSGSKRLLVALSNCIADGIPGLARSCLVTVTWMSCSLSSLHSAKRNRLALACSVLTPRLLETLSYDKAVEERVLASLSLLSFARHRECLKMLIPLSKETIASLEDLSRITWTADELLFMCSLWSNTLNQGPKDLFDNDTD